MLYINTKSAPKWAFILIITVILFLGYLLSGCSGKDTTICDELTEQRHYIILNNSEAVGAIKATDSMLIICGCTGNHTNPGP